MHKELIAWTIIITIKTTTWDINGTASKIKIKKNRNFLRFNFFGSEEEI